MGVALNGLPGKPQVNVVSTRAAEQNPGGRRRTEFRATVRAHNGLVRTPAKGSSGSRPLLPIADPVLDHPVYAPHSELDYLGESLAKCKGELHGIRHQSRPQRSLADHAIPLDFERRSPKNRLRAPFCAHPFTTPRGRSLATRRAMPAPCTTSTTASTSL